MEGRLSQRAEMKECSYPGLFTHFGFGFSWFCRFSGLLHGSSKNNTETATPSAPPLGMLCRKSVYQMRLFYCVAKPGFDIQQKCTADIHTLAGKSSLEMNFAWMCIKQISQIKVPDNP